MAWRAEDPVLWVGANRLDPHHPKFAHIEPQLYNLDAVAYEGLMLGLFSIHQGPPNAECGRLRIQKRSGVPLGFGRDGFHWHRPDRRPFLRVAEREGDWNWGNMPSAGGGCLVVGHRLYFYVIGRSRTEDFWDGRAGTGLGPVRRDGFASLDAGEAEGTPPTRAVRFAGKLLFLFYPPLDRHPPYWYNRPARALRMGRWLRRRAQGRRAAQQKWEEVHRP